MNRTQRRAAGLTTKVYSEAEVLRIKQQVRSDTLTRAAYAYNVILGITLRNDLGFGKKRIDRFVQRFKLQCDCLNEERVTVSDMEEQLRSETGVVIL